MIQPTATNQLCKIQSDSTQLHSTWLDLQNVTPATLAPPTTQKEEEADEPLNVETSEAEGFNLDPVSLSL